MHRKILREISNSILMACTFALVDVNTIFMRVGWRKKIFTGVLADNVLCLSHDLSNANYRVSWRLRWWQIVRRKGESANVVAFMSQRLHLSHTNTLYNSYGVVATKRYIVVRRTCIHITRERINNASYPRNLHPSSSQRSVIRTCLAISLKK